MSGVITIPAPPLGRRALLGGLALPLLGLPLLWSVRAAADEAPADIGIYCDPALTPAIREAADRFAERENGVPVSVLTAPARLILGQLAENPGEDILVLPSAAMDVADSKGLVLGASRMNAWRNRLVLATRAGTTPQGAPNLADLLATGRIAVTDRTPAAMIDGMALLAALGVDKLVAGRVDGVPTTEEAADMAATGEVRWALVYMTDVKADDRLEVAAVLDTAAAPVTVFSAALNGHHKEGHGSVFLAYLASEAGKRVMQRFGLEIAA